VRTCAGASRCVTVRYAGALRSCVTIIPYTVGDDMLNGGALRCCVTLSVTT